MLIYQRVQEKKKTFSDFKAGCDTKLCVKFEAGVQPEATPAILRTRHKIWDRYPKYIGDQMIFAMFTQQELQIEYMLDHFGINPFLLHM